MSDALKLPAMAPDGRLYSVSKKGELYELKVSLNATTSKQRKTALKRTVAAMTLGKDVSSLFTDVVKNTAGDLAMKKLVYLYIINYAPSKPDLAILIVNTFIKDAADPNPLIRALAIRTMSLIPLDKISEYLCAPLHAALKDRDPYVRKTAAVAVAKLFDTNPSLAMEEGFLHELQDLLADGNPMTVSNAVAALSEISETTGDKTLLSLTPKSVPRLLSALSECTEWGQVFILDSLATYEPSDAEEADLMVERIVPRLQHVNPAVVLATVRIVVNLMPHLDSDAKRDFLIKKMSAPLITLLNSQPEMQFVALRNISLLIREYPALLSNDVRIFFASYADPLYVKNEKLDVLVRLTTSSNAKNVLAELAEYTNEVDVVFAQKAVASIGHIGLRVPAVSKDCITLLKNLLRTRVAHITEQIAIVLKDLLRKYPSNHDDIIQELCKVAEDIDDPPAKASLVWIIGEYSHRINESVSMLSLICETIDEENVAVQLQILTACMKAYLHRGSEVESVTQRALKYATEESENVDVRDRGFIYARLLSLGNDTARSVVLVQQDGVEDRALHMPIELQKELVRSLSSVASVYHKPPREFQSARRKLVDNAFVGDLMVEEDLLGLDISGDDDGEAEAAATDSGFGGFGNIGGSSASSSKQVDTLQDIFGGAI